VGRVVVHSQVEVCSRTALPVDPVRELQELTMARTKITRPCDCLSQHIQGPEKTGRPAAFIVMRHRLKAPFSQRQTRLGSVNRLCLGFLVCGQHKSLVRGIEVKPRHIGQFLEKLLVFEHFVETAH
jgi:hypothetical protein